MHNIEPIKVIGFFIALQEHRYDCLSDLWPQQPDFLPSDKYSYRG